MQRARAPRDLALEVEREPRLPPGDDERMVGYGVMAAPFRSGDILAMRRFAATSIGHGYTSLWHRDADGYWAFYSDCEPLEACPRYFGQGVSHAVTTPIELRWATPTSFDMSVPAAEIDWHVELEATGATRFLNRVGEAMPDAWWKNETVLRVMESVAGSLLHAGRLGLSGHLPNGQAFIANPEHVWVIKTSRATIKGRDLGELGSVGEQAHLGDFWLPERALFATGRAFFETSDPTRHVLVAEAPP